ncbi:M20/M25/M40 family metallo-hydrolase (plasmid) [Deinococcus sp. KNUC1210]|uniref:M42 family metallopeptidase n=1 Tax=Deinococcus sp. KNUC1210 TaxID=2917691 RepID=UPI001EF15A5C|nr:M20/M25/M40 family metallo-hydrolase [Deinococcus sp. KNUC1210]ULH17056.1 M20/M25/M40 family metallo-hydrolase [Deinococcus sp. KNUC1210]
MTTNPADSSVMTYLRRLVELTGPSGSEEDVVRRVAEFARPYADSTEIDAFGNVIAIRRAAQEGARQCIISAHMDEIGFRVRKIEADGFLRLEKVGGSDDRILPAQRVWVRTRTDRLLGVIGTKSAHLLGDADRTSVVPYAQLYVDIGARSAAEVDGMGIAIGDPVGFVGDLAELGKGSGRYTAHALDDRAGCALLLTLLERLHQESPPVTLIAVFSVQEEVGLRGVEALARHLQGDVALAIDMTAADDTPEIAGHTLRLGAGPTIKVMDFSTLAHPAIRRGLLGAAGRADLNVQHEILKGIGTDAGALQYLGKGVPTGAVSVTNRYTHSPVEVLDQADLEGAVELIHQFLLALPDMPLTFLD